MMPKLYSIATIPNILTILRILGAPLLFYLISVQSAYEASFTLFCLISLTDWFDGFIARHFHQESALGRLLDPLADKLLTLCIYGALYPDFPLLFWIVVGRDILILSGIGVTRILNLNLPIRPVFISKVNTAVLSLIPGFVLGFKAGYLGAVMNALLGLSAKSWIDQPGNFETFFAQPLCLFILLTTCLSLMAYAKIFIEALTQRNLRVP